MQKKYLAGCKINLGLSITGVREDGYHTLDSLFWPLQHPHDILVFTLNDTNQICVTCTENGIDLKNNTLTKAYTAFHQQGGKAPGVHVELIKNIPHGAGLGGGSSDAACTLQWLNTHATTPLSPEKLHLAALTVGADVPFFLYNKPAQIQGIGEIITPASQNSIQLFQNKHAVLVCPKVNISTPWAYAAFDQEKNTLFTNQCLTKKEHKDKHELACVTRLNACLLQGLINDFEPVIFAKHTILQELKESMYAHGAFVACMSGSGSTIFGLFHEEKIAKAAAKSLTNTGNKVFTATL